MKSRSSRRLRPAEAALGALAGCGALLLASAASALGDEATATHQTGYPRSSDTPPPALEDPPDGYGDDNPTSTSYDSNWLFDATAGESDVVLLTVRDACIQGYAQVEDADSSGATARRKDAWGEDRLLFSPSGTVEGDCEFSISNRIRIAASWNLQGNGVNAATLRAQALDVKGNVHVWVRNFSVDPGFTATTVTTEGGEYRNQSSAGANAGTDSGSISGEQSTTYSVTGATNETVSVTSGSAITDEDEVRFLILDSQTGTSCTARIASAEMIDVQAQAIVDGVQTTVKIPYFDTVNVVSASYTVETPSDPGGAGTPGGEDPTPPETPGGGDDPTGPTTPGGDEPTEPEPSDEPVTPPSDEDEPLPEGSEPDGEDPVTPPDPESEPDSSGGLSTGGG